MSSMGTVRSRVFIIKVGALLWTPWLIHPGHKATEEFNSDPLLSSCQEQIKWFKHRDRKTELIKIPSQKQDTNKQLLCPLKHASTSLFSSSNFLMIQLPSSSLCTVPSHKGAACSLSNDEGSVQACCRPFGCPNHNSFVVPKRQTQTGLSWSSLSLSCTDHESLSSFFFFLSVFIPH